MPTMLKSCLIIAMSCAWNSTAWSKSPTLSEIVARAEANYSGFGGQRVVAEMQTIDRSGAKKTYGLIELELESKHGRRMLLRITSPKTHAGTAILVREVSGLDDEIYLYLPQARSLKRISSADQITNFLGSELDLEQLTFPKSSDHHQRLLGESEAGGQACWEIEHLQKSTQGRHKKKTISCVAKDNYSTLRVRYFDRAGEELKIVSSSEHKQYAGQWRPHKITVDNVQSKRQTVFSTKSYQLGLRLSEKIFSPEQLRKALP
jgi:hypothetical protein